MKTTTSLPKPLAATTNPVDPRPTSELDCYHHPTAAFSTQMTQLYVASLLFIPLDPR